MDQRTALDLYWDTTLAVVVERHYWQICKKMGCFLEQMSFFIIVIFIQNFDLAFKFRYFCRFFKLICMKIWTLLRSVKKVNNLFMRCFDICLSRFLLKSTIPTFFNVYFQSSIILNFKTRITIFFRICFTVSQSIYWSLIRHRSRYIFKWSVNRLCWRLIWSFEWYLSLFFFAWGYYLLAWRDHFQCRFFYIIARSKKRKPTILLKHIL